MALALLYKSSESIGAAYEPSASAAMRELERRSGKTVVVLAPVGGARTKQQCNDLGTPWYISDHWEGKGRALDVNNRGEVTTGLAQREGISFSAAVLLYYKIWAKYGWRNIQVNGADFSTEPWHMANHSTIPAGSAGTPLPDVDDRKKGGKDMSIYLHGPDTGTATAPGPRVLVVASPGVWDRYKDTTEQRATLGSQFGSPVALSLESMLAKKEEYLNPVGYGTGGTINVPPQDNTAILAALAKVEAAINRLNPPG